MQNHVNNQQLTSLVHSNGVVLQGEVVKHNETAESEADRNNRDHRKLLLLEHSLPGADLQTNKGVNEVKERKRNLKHIKHYCSSVWIYHSDIIRIE